MHRTAAALLVSLAFWLTAQAQETPKVEVFAGYSVTRVSFPIASDPAAGSARATLQGWNASAAFNVNRWVGVLIDESQYYGHPTVSEVFKPANCVLCTGEVTATLKNINTFFVGPQFSIRRDKTTVFAHPLIGFSHVQEDLVSSVVPSAFIFSTTKAYMLGGGVDVALSQHIALRAQPDYLLMQFFGRRHNDFHLSTGVVFRFGHLQ